MKGWEFRRRRRDAGLTLRQVARAAGTTESNVSAYERGAKPANAVTLARLAAAIDAGHGSPVHQMRLTTAPAAAAAIRRGLREGWRTADLLRVVRELRANTKLVQHRNDIAAMFARPSTTGDPRWDAMLAGVIEELALASGIAPPAWVRGKALSEFWFVGSTPALHAYAFARSPMALQVRGVMVDPADLDAV